MCRESFWKRITIFCLALGIGTIASDFWFSEELSESKKMKNSVSKERNCVFADKDLKYENLPLKEEIYILPQVGEKPEIKPIPLEKEELKKSEIETNQNNFPESIPPLYIPSQSSAEYQILLHKENCYEPEEGK